MKDLLCERGEPASDRLRVPGDKSISHRALLLGAFTDGVTRIDHLNRGSAVEALLGPLRRLGARFEERGEALFVLPPDRVPQAEPRLDLGRSSAAARFLIGILAGRGIRAVVDGEPPLRHHPMGWLIEPLRRLGAGIEELGEEGRLPVALTGGTLRPGTVELRIGSAQARSGVLLAAVAAGVPVTLHFPVRSRDHTERLLVHAGIRLEEGERRVRYAGGRPGPLPRLLVPGDPSLAAYPVAYRLLSGEDAPLAVEEVCVNPTRTGFFDVLRRAGAGIRYEGVRERCGERVGRIVIEGGAERLRPFTVDDPFTFHAAIDEVPLLCAVAARIRGRSEIRGAGELSFKETDRLATTRDMLRAFGAEVETTPDSIAVSGGRPLCPGRVPSFGDQRIAMAAAALAATLPGRTRIVEGSCFTTSFPDFVETMNRAGARLRLAEPLRSAVNPDP